TDNRLRALPVPPVSILSLVENSIKYGVKDNEVLRITITARRLEMDGGVLANIMVTDNGPGFTPRQLESLNKRAPQEKNGQHVGLANTVRRLQLLYGKNMAVAFANSKTGGARIELFLPIEEEEKKTS
ncbi:MAG: ATP-binding protein, partial [Oscillospiraceae bacterium]|nr:ATP-binding protein [Oscillospiraceae bacterium]